MSDVKSQITPGMGSRETQSAAPASNASSGAQAPEPQAAPPSATPPSANAPDAVQGEAPTIGKASDIPTIVTTTTAVEVPVTVKDNKGNFVAGLTWRDFRIYENNQPQRIAWFSVDPFPLSIAFVIDQSLTQDTMAQVNNSLGALQGALASYDEVSVLAYNNGPKDVSGGFTGAQSHRLDAVLSLNKAIGRDEGAPVTGGALSGCSITANGSCVDPNLQVGHSAGSMEMNPAREIHTLNDAILLAATELSKRPPGRRRMIYVVSDGKEYGSKAKTKEVIHFLEQNKITLYATLVGDSARWGEGYLSRFHLPLQMNDDVLPKYTQATGGDLYAERSTNGIEKSYQKVAEEAHAQYTLVYYSHEPAIDGKYRSIEVRVDRPAKEVEITTKQGYYPTALDVH